ncbi:MAG: ABC transporter ATP-binding protein [Magnetospirillum sp.]|jgi:putative hydroxymethylpyrimidine transport system ATP-binding protein|nr:ABC transporter ATP-binding protein [Magnetospirillum sp.]
MDKISPAVAGFGLHVRQARVAFGGTVLFDDLSFDLAPGSFTCLLGPSGIGKSTLLRLIAGLAPDDARAEINADDGFPLAGRVAWMAQTDLLCPWLDVAANVALGASLRGTGIDSARVAALLEAVGLADKTHAMPNTLSGGQRQRAALARTLMEDRPLVLMDEPFGALDAITRWRLQDLALQLLAGRTVLLVTHDPREALRMGDTVRVLAGRPAALGAPLHPRGLAPGALHEAEHRLLDELAATAA